MFHVIIDKQSQAYVSSGARNAIGVTPFAYLARYFVSPMRAVEFLEACGFGKERASRFRILHFDKAPKQLGAEGQRVVEAAPRSGRPRIRRAPL